MIWCVEDDSSIRDIEVYALTSTGFEAKGFEDGDSFWNALQSEKPELIVLDVMLPGKDGVTLLKLMKSNEAFADIPVIMATAKGSEYDKIQSLDLGADDYLVKPFNPDELIARLEAIIRRSLGGSYNNDILQFKDLTLNLTNKKAKIGDNDINLPGKQFDILECLISQQGVIITKEQIFDKIWGFNSDTTTNVVEVYASALRKELKKYGYDEYIKTIRGVGYMLDK